MSSFEANIAEPDRSKGSRSKGGAEIGLLGRLEAEATRIDIFQDLRRVA